MGAVVDDPVLAMLGRLRASPSMYVGRYSAEALFLFLAGYVAALSDHTDCDTSRYATFIDGLYEKYGRGGGGESWATVLGRIAGGDGAGLELFFAELDLYQSQYRRPATEE